jgi:[protein-PII] uridylyltransferase
LVRQTDEIAPSDAELRDRLRPAIVRALGVQDAPSLLDDFLNSMPARYLLATPPAHIARHVRLIQRRVDTPLLLATESGPTTTIMNVTLCVEERRGIFAMIAGALSQNNLNILTAQIYTSKLGLAIDTLQVEAWDKTPLNNPKLWQQVETDLLQALDGTRQFDATPAMRRHPTQTRQFQTFVQEPHIVLDNTSSDSHTVIEIKAQDSLGLLYKLTHLLYEQGLDIALAKISTEANRAIDVFYVTDAGGNKILDVAAQDAIREHLTNALS